MIKIFLETGKKTTQEYVFIKTLLVTKLNKPSSDYELIMVGGWNALPQVVNAFKSNTLENGENLIVFDADFAENGGGYISSMKSLTMAQRHKLGQGEWCFDNDEYWDLDSEELKPLKDFLNK
jgi:hypothetical protein